MTTTKLDDDLEPADEVAMTPAAIQTRAEMAHNWAASRAPEGVLPWSVRQHFGEDMPKLIETVVRLAQEKGEQLDLNAELMSRLMAVRALETSRIGADNAIGEMVRVDPSTDPATFYAGVSFALAKVHAALRDEATR